MSRKITTFRFTSIVMGKLICLNILQVCQFSLPKCHGCDAQEIIHIETLQCQELNADTHTAASNAADAPKANASEATDNTEIHTAAVNAANAIDVNEDETFKKPSGDMTDDGSQNKSLKNQLQGEYIGWASKAVYI